MACTTLRWRSVLLLVLIGLATAGMPARATEPAGIVALVSDIHFNPFAAPELAPQLAGAGPERWPSIFASASGQSFSARGEDTNQALLASALATLSEQARDADLVIVSGDILAHRFQETAAQVLGTSPNSSNTRELASKTALYVAGRLRAALPGRPILIALGNNDSECGDYQLEPGGAFLTSLRDTVRDLAGADRLAQDFDHTYMTGGYYAMRHPRLAGTTILVINDVLWSTNYQDACSTKGDQAADAMMGWLEQQLDKARVAGQRVWLVHHIPVGIDSYATLHAPAELSCPAQVTPFLKEPFASRFVMLLRNYAAIVQANFSGHIHQDSYRLITDAGVAVGIEKIAPAISPIFGNNPGFHLIGYDRQTGDLIDFSTWYLANLEHASGINPAEWRREYIFTEAYRQKTYSATSVQTIAKALTETSAEGEQARSTFRRLYPVSHGEITTGTLPAYACAIGNLAPWSFIACYCNK